MPHCKPQKWELWWADVPYEDQPVVSKIRPVLVLENKGCYIIAGKMTSSPPRSEFDYEYAIQDWKGAGLAHETTLRLYKTLNLNESAFKRKIGDLQPVDLIEVMKILDQIQA